MNKSERFFRRYIFSIVSIIILFLFVNILLVASFFAAAYLGNVKNSNFPIEDFSNHITETNGQFNADIQAEDMLNNACAWAMILDENGKPVDIYEYEHNSATDLIEDFMLLANETVAEEYYFNEIPFVYRTHEEPDSEKIESVFSMIRAGKIKVKKAKENVSPKEIQQVLKEIEGLECEPFFARLLLRSMKQAKYTTDCIGHFGLAARYYCHFTSPIRRYPDLQIHRIIKENLRSRMTKEKKQHYKEILPDVASRSSMLERRAEEVERETVKMKKAEYMMAHIGEEFEGIISGVTEWGFYVELSNTIEGLVHVNLLTDDYYEYDREHYTLTGEDTGKVYKMGQKIRVKVSKADLATRTVDFLPAKEKTAVFSYLDEE